MRMFLARHHLVHNRRHGASGATWQTHSLVSTRSPQGAGLESPPPPGSRAGVHPLVSSQGKITHREGFHLAHHYLFLFNTCPAHDCCVPGTGHRTYGCVPDQ